MRSGEILCNACKRPIVHPGLIDLKCKARLNVGVANWQRTSESNPGITEGIMGFVEVEIGGDFCDEDCLKRHIANKAYEANPSVANVSQRIFFRGDSLTPGKPKREW
jgi:hypothetical protein